MFLPAARGANGKRHIGLRRRVDNGLPEEVPIADIQRKHHWLRVGDTRVQLARLAAQHSAIVSGARGIGLMLALELRSADTAKSVTAAMMERRILINRTSETVLRFLPPYILGKSHVDLAIAALDEVLRGHAPAEADAEPSATHTRATHGGTSIGR